MRHRVDKQGGGSEFGRDVPGGGRLLRPCLLDLKWVQGSCRVMRASGSKEAERDVRENGTQDWVQE